jgi:RNA polymerase sigma-70 factor, ECF subfamily
MPVSVTEEYVREDAPPPSWEAILKGVVEGDQYAVTELFGRLERGARLLAGRQLNWQGEDDCVHDAFVSLIDFIQQNRVLNADSLPSLFRTILHRRIITEIKSRQASRKREVSIEFCSVVDHSSNPERATLGEQQRSMLRQALERLSTLDREVLVRFYVLEQAKEQICAELNLTDTQFRLRKTRAKQSVSAIGQKSLRPKRPRAPVLRWFHRSA